MRLHIQYELKQSSSNMIDPAQFLILHTQCHAHLYLQGTSMLVTDNATVNYRHLRKSTALRTPLWITSLVA